MFDVEDYFLPRGRKSASRYLQVAQQLLEVNPGEEEPFEALHVNRFLSSLSRGGALGRTLRLNYYSSSRSSALWVIPPVDQYGTEEDTVSHPIVIVPHRDRTGCPGRKSCHLSSDTAIIG